jgi:phosphoenolpyruvate carboxykinase (GTP)
LGMFIKREFQTLLEECFMAPVEGAIYAEGLDFSSTAFEEIQRVDEESWRNEVIGHEELFLQLHAHLPKELIYERELLICRL